MKNISEKNNLIAFLCLVTLLAASLALNGCSGGVGDTGQSNFPTGGGAQPTPSTPTISHVSPTIVNPGGTLTITGTGFGTQTEGSSVTIGGVVCTIMSWTDTQIVVTVGAVPPGTWDVIVTTPAGSSPPGTKVTVVNPITKKVWHTAAPLSSNPLYTYDSNVTPYEPHLQPLPNTRAANVKAVGQSSMAVYFSTSNNQPAVMARKFNGTAWEAEARIDNVDGQIPIFSNVATDTKGNAVAAWYQCDSGGTPHVYAAYYNGTTWTTPQIVDSNNDIPYQDHLESYYYSGYYPGLAFDNAGHAVIVYRTYNSDTGHYGYFTNRYTAATDTWETAIAVDMPFDDTQYTPNYWYLYYNYMNAPKVQFFKNSVIGYIVFSEPAYLATGSTGQMTERIFVRRVDAGNASWTIGGALADTVEQIDAFDFNSPDWYDNTGNYDIALTDTTGFIVYAKVQYYNGYGNWNNYVYASSFDPSTRLWVPVTNENQALNYDSANQWDPYDYVRPVVDFLSNGRAVTAYQNGKNWNHLATLAGQIWDPATGWGTPTPISVSQPGYPGSAGPPSLATDASGNAMVTFNQYIWTESESSNFRLYAALYTNGVWVRPLVDHNINPTSGYDYDWYSMRRMINPVVFDPLSNALCIFMGRDEWNNPSINYNRYY